MGVVVICVVVVGGAGVDFSLGLGLHRRWRSRIARSPFARPSVCLSVGRSVGRSAAATAAATLAAALRASRFPQGGRKLI